MSHQPHFAVPRRSLLLVLGLILMATTACQFNGHRTMGATEKLVHGYITHLADNVEHRHLECFVGRSPSPPVQALPVTCTR